VVERRAHAGIATFFAEQGFGGARQLSLGESEAHHVRVRRLNVGDRVRLVDGAGHSAEGVLIRIARAQAVVEVDGESVVEHEPAPDVHLMLPVADRERMLLLAEKAVELAASSWRPVLWRRSRSVVPRGEGVAFQGKLRARMVAALTQSGGAWLPAHHPDAPLDRAIAAAPEGVRLLLDAGGGAFPRTAVQAPVTIAVGPEGGMEDAEREALVAAGFLPVSLGPTTLRFETAAVVALGLARAVLSAQEVNHG
jgi:16S rRNA (uracil1498-N3)-methyltransferase